MAVNNYVAYRAEVEQKQENEEEDIQYIVEHMAQTHIQPRTEPNHIDDMPD
jgi:lipase chaperone LimK